MPVERIGTDERDILTIRASAIAGSTIDGRGAEDVLELAGHFGVFDFTLASVLVNVERLRLVGSSPIIRFSADQLTTVKSFESPNESTFSLEVTGAIVDLRDKVFDAPMSIRLATPGATLFVNDKKAALALDGSYLEGELLVLEGSALTDAERRVLHKNGVDRVRDVTGVTSEDRFAPSITGFNGNFDAQLNNKIKPFKDAVVTEDIGFDHVSVSMGKLTYGREKFTIEASGSLRVESSTWGDNRVYINDDYVGSYYDSFTNSFHFNFSDKSTAAHAEQILRSLVYEYVGGDIPATPNVLSLSMVDVTSKSTSVSVSVNYPNFAPTDINVSGIVYEDTSVGAYIGGIRGTDPNIGDELTFSLVDDAGGRFSLNKFDDSYYGGWALILAQKLDYEAAHSHNITVKATDAMGASFIKTFTIEVWDVDEQPIPDDDWDVDDEERPIPGAVYDSDLRGTSRGDRLVGADNNDRLLGFSGSDTLFGNGGNDALSGGLGRDILWGGAGRDVFIFDTKVAARRNTNVDKIMDFKVVDDTIFLSKSIFKALGKKQATLSKDAFWMGAGAHDANDRIIYNKKTGALFYDADGTGSAAAIQIATLTKTLKMTHKDFFVI